MNDYTDFKVGHKTTLAQKNANGQRWIKYWVKHYAGHRSAAATSLHEHFSPAKTKHEWYQAYNGEFSEEYFQGVDALFKHKKEGEIEEDKGYRGSIYELKGFNLIRPLIDILIGDFTERPFAHAVKVNNPDAVSKLLEAEHEQIMDYLAKTFEQRFAANKGEQSGELPPLSKVKEEFNLNYKDERAITGQKALEYLMDDQKVFHKLKQLVFDYFVGGRGVSLKEIRNDEVYYSRVNPLEFKRDETTEFAEDASWAVISKQMNLSDIMDRYYKDINKVQKLLDSDERVNPLEELTKNNKHTLDPTFTVDIVYFKTFVKIGLLSYLDEFGTEQVIEVPDDYVPEEDESLEIVWVNTVFTGEVVDSKYFFNLGPYFVQRNRMNNSSECKLPVNDIKFSAVNADLTSIPQLLKPYQKLYILTLFMMEQALANHIGQAVVLDKNSIPAGWDITKWVYYLKKIGVLVVEPEAGVNPTYASINASTIQEVQGFLSVLDKLESMCERVLNISPSRRGEMADRATTGATEAAIKRSTLASEAMFADLDYFIEVEMVGLLDVSKHAWRKGKKQIHIGSDFRSAILEIDPNNYAATDYGIIATHSTKETEYISKFKDQTIQAFAQNGGSPADLMEMALAQSVPGIRIAAEKFEQKRAKATQDQQEAEAKQAQAAQQAADQAALMDHQRELEKIDREGQWKLALAELGASPETPDTSGEDRALDERKHVTEMQSKNKKDMVDAQLKVAELGVKKYTADKQVEIAKANKNKYDKE